MSGNSVVKFLIIMLLAPLLFLSSAISQPSGFRISGGLSAIEIIGDNVSTYPFVIEKDGRIYYGGSFNQSHSGLRLEGIFPLDQDGVFEIPIGFEYNFFMGREKTPISDDGSNIKFRHDVDVATITVGFNYSFYHFNPLNSKAKFYVGIDTRTTRILNSHYESEIYYAFHDSTDLIAYYTKDPTFRFGGTINLGLNGEIHGPFSVDFRFGMGVMNLFGRDPERGELLTPRKQTGDYIERNESTIFTFNFAMLIQYRM